MPQQFRVPPGWPTPPAGWTPPPNWQPDPSWPPPPPGWRFWTDDVISHADRPARHPARYVGTVEGPPPPKDAPPVSPGRANAAIAGAVAVAVSAALPYISTDVPLEGTGGVTPTARYVVLGTGVVLLAIAILTRLQPRNAGWPRLLLVLSALLAVLAGGWIGGGYHGVNLQDRYGGTAFVHVHPAAGEALTALGTAVCLVGAYLVTRRLRQVRQAAVEKARFARARAFALGDGPAGHF